MSSSVTVAEVFRAVGLKPHGPVRWGKPVVEAAPGVYLVSLTPNPTAKHRYLNVDYLSSEEQERWLPGEPVLYIGRTSRKLCMRLCEFYCHEYGDSSPHRGGQAIKLLRGCPLWVFWAGTERFLDDEREMIAFFKDRMGSLPFANRKRGSRSRKRPRP